MTLKPTETPTPINWEAMKPEFVKAIRRAKLMKMSPISMIGDTARVIAVLASRSTPCSHVTVTRSVRALAPPMSSTS